MKRWMRGFRALVFVWVASFAPSAGLASAQDIQVVATLSVYRDIAEEILGNRGVARSIAEPRQDAHFVQAKPSYSIMLSRADLLVATGLDLELWLPAVIDKSRNPRIREGEPGYVSVATGVPMLQVPDDVSRAGGDIHIFGNPHIHTDPLRAIIIAENIKTGLQNVDPEGRTHYESQFDNFKLQIHQRLFGEELVELVGGDRLAELAMQGRLRPYLENNQLGGEALAARLAGWMQEAACLWGKRIVAYHLNWIYFVDRFGIEIASYVERRPGIPPSAAHVADLIALIRRENIQVLWVANYFDERIPRLIADRTGASFLYVPLYTGGESTPDYVSLVDHWIDTMKTGFSDCSDE